MLDDGGRGNCNGGSIDRYAAIYGPGAIMPGGQLEIEQHRVIGMRPIEAVEFVGREPGRPGPLGGPEGRAQGLLRTGRLHRRPPSSTEPPCGLAIGSSGPAIIERMGDSVVIPPGYEAAVDAYLTLRLTASERTIPAPAQMQERTS